MEREVESEEEGGGKKKGGKENVGFLLSSEKTNTGIRN